MSVLWALTGSIDPRPLQDSKAADVVNDHCKVSVFGPSDRPAFSHLNSLPK